MELHQDPPDQLNLQATQDLTVPNRGPRAETSRPGPPVIEVSGLFGAKEEDFQIRLALQKQASDPSALRHLAGRREAAEKSGDPELVESLDREIQDLFSEGTP